MKQVWGHAEEEREGEAAFDRTECRSQVRLREVSFHRLEEYLRIRFARKNEYLRAVLGLDSTSTSTSSGIYKSSPFA